MNRDLGPDLFGQAVKEEASHPEMVALTMSTQGKMDKEPRFSLTHYQGVSFATRLAVRRIGAGSSSKHLLSMPSHGPRGTVSRDVP